MWGKEKTMNLSIAYSQDLYGKLQNFTTTKLQNLQDTGTDPISSFDIMDGKDFKDGNGKINQNDYAYQLLSLSAGEILAKDLDGDLELSFDEFIKGEEAELPEPPKTLLGKAKNFFTKLFSGQNPFKKDDVLSNEERAQLKESFDYMSNIYEDGSSGSISINEMAEFYKQQDMLDGNWDGKLTI